MDDVKPPTSAAILVRISDDRDGEAAGVARQEADARLLADKLGWTVTDVIQENDTSAFKRRRVRLPDGTTALRVDRPDFRRLLDLIDSGQVDGLVAYHLDRVARDPRDLEDLIDVVERNKIPVESVTGSLRLATDSEITMARIGVAIANQASRDSSRRIRRKHEELAENGIYGGGGARRYGYERDGITPRQDEVEVITEAVQRVLAGETVSSICRDLDSRLILPVKAERWSSKALTDILRSPRIAGLRVHRGEVVGTAAWPALIDRETHDELVATLHGRSRGAGKPALVRWANMLLFCGRCGHWMSGAYAGPDRFRYWCNHRRGGCGRMAIAGAQTEDELERQVLGYLSRPDVLDALARGRTEGDAAVTRNAIGEDEQQLKALARMWAEKAITLDEYAEARKIIESRLSAARLSLRAVVPSHVRSVLESKEVLEAWGGLSPSDRRDVAQTILTANGFKGWTVAPADLSKPRRFDADRLTLALS